MFHRLTTYAQVHDLKQKEVSGLQWVEELRCKVENNELTKETLELAKKVLEEWDKIQRPIRERQKILWQNYSGTPICVDCYRVKRCVLSPTSACSLYRKSPKQPMGKDGTSPTVMPFNESSKRPEGCGSESSKGLEGQPTSKEGGAPTPMPSSSEKPNLLIPMLPRSETTKKEASE